MYISPLTPHKKSAGSPSTPRNPLCGRLCLIPRGKSGWIFKTSTQDISTTTSSTKYDTVKTLIL